MNAPYIPERTLRRSLLSAAERAPRPVHDARLLTDGGNEARIVLDGTPYVLRITRLGKLILTK